MKKFFNGLGIISSIIVSIVLSFLIFLYVVVLNVKFIVNEKGMANTLKNMDFVETLKSAENGTFWEDFKQLGETLDLSEEQFEKILNSPKVKENVGGYFGRVLEAMFNDKEVIVTKEEVKKFLNIAINEFNKVSENKISDAEKEEILNLFDEEIMTKINDELGSINLINEVDSEYVVYVELLDNLLFGNYTLIMLVAIFLLICLIALFRFSYYKWISYVSVSTIISSILMIVLGLLLLFLPLEDVEIIMPFRQLLAVKSFITSAILVIVSIVLIVIKKKWFNKKIDTLVL